MTDPARELWLDFAAEIEAQQGERGAMESIADWSSKLPGAAARIAALLELADCGPAAESVSLEATEKAVRLCRLLIPHAHAAFGLLGADATDTDATAIVKWARDGGRLVVQQERMPESDGRALPELPAWRRLSNAWSRGDVVKVEKVPNKGAPPTTMIRMNPKLFVEKG
jgi:replicative DNA helicase